MAAKPVAPKATVAPSSVTMADIAAIDRESVDESRDMSSYGTSPDRETLQSVRREFEARGEERIIKNKRGKGFLLFLLALIAVIALALVLSSVFHSVTVTLTPRTASAALNEAVTTTNAQTANSILPYQVVTVKTVGTQKVAATGEEKVDKAATGTIIIYNNYNANSQRLVKNTRFETPEGLIYRITDSVTVPGKVGGTPGSVEATVVADATGDKYNAGLKDFTIPGFKNDPRYTTFYARSKTPLAGGFTGTVKVVADADRIKAQNDITARATAELLKKVGVEKSADSVFFSNAYSVSCTPLQQETLSDKEALIKMDCSLSAVMFDMQVLASFLAKKHVNGYTNDAVKVDNISDLVFTPKAGFAPATSETISFTITGNAAIEWVYDGEALKSALTGKRRTEVPSILQAYPMIERADISVRPAWRRSLPVDPTDIHLVKAQ